MGELLDRSETLKLLEIDILSTFSQLVQSFGYSTDHRVLLTMSRSCTAQFTFSSAIAGLWRSRHMLLRVSFEWISA